jgi:hypothetical protein
MTRRVTTTARMVAAMPEIIPVKIKIAKTIANIILTTLSMS